MKDKQRSTSQVKDKHTPGPWKVDGTYIYEVEQDKILAEVETYNNNELPYEANARLMAAAPEMFEFIRKVLRWELVDYDIHEYVMDDEEVRDEAQKLWLKFFPDY